MSRFYEEDERPKEVVKENGIYKCPECGSKKITTNAQCVLHKKMDANTGKLLNPKTNKTRMSNQEKAFEYNMASMESIGCWYHECRKCGWTGDLEVE